VSYLTFMRYLFFGLVFIVCGYLVGVFFNNWLLGEDFR